MAVSSTFCMLFKIIVRSVLQVVRSFALWFKILCISIFDQQKILCVSSFGSDSGVTKNCSHKYNPLSLSINLILKLFYKLILNHFCYLLWLGGEETEGIRKS